MRKGICVVLVLPLNREEKHTVLEKLVPIATANGVVLKACSDNEALEYPDIKRAKCVDGKLITKLTGFDVSHAKDGGQRKDCQCTKSRDIGVYSDVCNHGCLYCYANPATTLVSSS